MTIELLNNPRSILAITPDGRRTTIAPEEVIEWIEQMREFAHGFGAGGDQQVIRAASAPKRAGSSGGRLAR